MLTFDAARHEYHVDGALVPHVTEVLSPLTEPLYRRIKAEDLERARQQGTAIHKMVELDCHEDLDVAKLPRWLSGPLAAWYRFKDETGFRCYASEEPVWHERLMYAGTLDLAGELPKFKGSKKPCVIDVKRSLYAGPVIGLQTAAYAGAWCSDKARPFLDERYALALYPNGIYRLEPFTDRDDSIAFLACLQQHRWKEKHYGR